MYVSMYVYTYVYNYIHTYILYTHTHSNNMMLMYYKIYQYLCKSGQTIALVGKSTVATVIEKFDDPLKGGVLLDDIDLQQLNIRWLRTQLVIISQEPILSGTSIPDNIRYGANHCELSDEEIIDVIYLSSYMFIPCNNNNDKE